MKFFKSQTVSSCLALLALLVTLSGCISTQPVSNLPPVPKDPASIATSPTDMLPLYRLQIGDVLDIKIMSNPEFNDQVTVRPDGMISTSIASDVPAYGHTASEVQAAIAERSHDILRDPKVAVIVRSFAPNRVYVLGEVRNPGEFITVGPNLTMLQAIARAGGLSNTAQPDNIIIIRRGFNSVSHAYAANFKAAATGEDASQDVRLAPYDVVFVPRSGIGDTYLYFQQYFQQFVPDSAAVYTSHSF